MTEEVAITTKYILIPTFWNNSINSYFEILYHPSGRKSSHFSHPSGKLDPIGFSKIAID